MSEYYSEQIVKRKTPAYKQAVKIILIAFTALFFVLGMMVPIFLLPTLLFGLLTYFFVSRLEIEYEYAFVSGELSIDKIYNKSRRKKCMDVDFDQTEIIAPLGAYQLDEYKNKQLKECDYTSGESEKEIFVMIVHKGSELVKILFEPNTRMLEDMRNCSPRKVILK